MPRLDGDCGARHLARGGALRRPAFAARLAVLAAQKRLAQRMRLGQVAVFGERIGRDHVRILDPRDERQRRQRQAEPERRVARHQEQFAGARAPVCGVPTAHALRFRVPALHGQHVADWLAESALEDARQARSRHRVIELVRGCLEILGQPAFLAHEVPRVFVRGRHGFGLELEPASDTAQEFARLIGRDAVVFVLGRH